MSPLFFFSLEKNIYLVFYLKELIQKASFLRATHPFATPETKSFFAYNLHVLSMLQAFILSQDQTHFYYKGNLIPILSNIFIQK